MAQRARKPQQIPADVLAAAVAAAIAQGKAQGALPAAAVEPQVPAERSIQSAQQTAPAQPQAIRKCIIVLDHKGNTVDVAQEPLVTGAQIIALGQAMNVDRALAFNVLNGITSTEVNDTSNKQVWGNVPNMTRNAFRKIRHFMQTGKNSQADDAEVICPPHAAVEYLRNKWAEYVNEKIEENKKAKAEDRKTVYRVRPISLQVLAKFIKGNAPKGGGVTGLKVKIADHVKKIKAALHAAKIKDKGVMDALKALEGEIATE